MSCGSGGAGHGVQLPLLRLVLAITWSPELREGFATSSPWGSRGGGPAFLVFIISRGY